MSFFGFPSPAYVLALAVVSGLSGAAPAAARTPFDGNWSVLIITERGGCDRAYRYGVEIANGNVTYPGGGVDFTGRVNQNGVVRVMVSAGGQSASGSGRLSRNSGGGKWAGQGASGACSGSWTAERRSAG